MEGTSQPGSSTSIRNPRIPLKRVASKPLVAYMSSAKWKPLRSFRRIQYAYRDYLAEFLATMVFLLLGIAINAQYKLNVKATDSFAPCFGWGLAIMCGVYIGRRVSVSIKQCSSL
jgi:NhaP-type Na+/H+ or K+/H+ antiporter